MSKINPLESKIETYLSKKARQNNALCFKFISGVNGVPDRIIIKDGKTIFIELKRPKSYNVSEIQKAMIKELKNNKIPTFVLNTKNHIDKLFEHIKKGDDLLCIDLGLNTKEKKKPTNTFQLKKKCLN